MGFHFKALMFSVCFGQYQKKRSVGKNCCVCGRVKEGVSTKSSNSVPTVVDIGITIADVNV